jgi:hypothetical protein
MPRKKTDNTEKPTIATTAVAEPATTPTPAAETIDPEMVDGKPAIHDAQLDASGEPTPKNWGPPYKAIYTNAAKGFELGEDRRWKQRVFKFTDKPGPHVIDALKAAGFKYRGEEKSWTVQATPVTRELSDQLAQQFAGPEADVGRSR